MTNQVEISNVAKETLYILEYFNPEFVAKIPLNFKNNLKEIAKNSNIIVKIDRNRKLKEQPILEETKELIASIYYSYVATEEQKKELIEIWSENERVFQEELRKKYNPDNIFKKNTQLQEKEELGLLEIKKENRLTAFFRKILKRIWKKDREFSRIVVRRKSWRKKE